MRGVAVADSAATDLAIDDLSPAPADLLAPPCPLEPSLVACYRFEDGTGSVIADQSMYANTATSYSVAFTPGVQGNAVELGATSSVRAPDSASLDATTQLTLEMWVRPTALPPPGGRAGLVDNDGQYGLFVTGSGELRCSMIAVITSAANVLPTGVFSHVACTYDGSFVRLYLNGKELVVGAAVGMLGTGNTNGLAIGSNSPTGDVLSGNLDELRIWNVARSASEVCAAWGQGGC
ncbi:MAG TPA: LamG domain-containing protein [Kofleriaceae bacterium]|nr:LamG domain-containing protein [Kofleriaceae bacterium]